MTDGGRQISARAHLRSSLRPRATRRQLLTGVLCAVLGFGAVTQVQSRDDESVLDTARQSDLIQILDAQGQLADRLEDELGDLQDAQAEFLSTGDQQRIAVEQALERRDVLGILAGTLAARGPGVTVTIRDTAAEVSATRLLGAVQELRNAGAEAIQVNDVRVVASTYFAAADDVLVVDGTVIAAPFEIEAIGDADTLATAMGIPGGVIDAFAADGIEADVRKEATVVVDAVRPAQTPEFAQPADGS